MKIDVFPAIRISAIFVILRSFTLSFSRFSLFLCYSCLSFLHLCTLAMAISFSDIANLALEHPLASSILLLLLFTPSLLPLLLYFSPLFISTTLCVITLYSVGPHLVATEEEEPATQPKSNLVLKQALPNKKVQAVEGKMTWADWMQGLDSNTRAWLERRLKQEGLLGIAPNREIMLTLIDTEKMRNCTKMRSLDSDGKNEKGKGASAIAEQKVYADCAITEQQEDQASTFVNLTSTIKAQKVDAALPIAEQSVHSASATKMPKVDAAPAIFEQNVNLASAIKEHKADTTSVIPQQNVNSAASASTIKERKVDVASVIAEQKVDAAAITEQNINSASAIKEQSINADFAVSQQNVNSPFAIKEQRVDAVSAIAEQHVNSASASKKLTASAFAAQVADSTFVNKELMIHAASVIAEHNVKLLATIRIQKVGTACAIPQQNVNSASRVKKQVRFAIAEKEADAVSAITEEKMDADSEYGEKDKPFTLHANNHDVNRLKKRLATDKDAFAWNREGVATLGRKEKLLLQPIPKIEEI